MRIGIIVCLIIVGIASVVGMWKAYSTPKTLLGIVPVINYQHRGSFDYIVYVNPGYLINPPTEAPQNTEEEQPSYFISIINDIHVQFEYVFSVDGSTESTSHDLEIVAIVNGPSGWQKEVPLLTREGISNNLRASFSLELEEFSELVKAIETEIGAQESPDMGEVYDVVIEAKVASTSSDTESISDIFIHPITINVRRGTLRWDNNLYLSERKIIGGVSYKHQGNFNYTIGLKENSLYSSDIKTLSSKTYYPPQPIALPAAERIFINITDIIQFNFSYVFMSNRAVRNLTEEVEVAAILKTSDGESDIWSKTFVLLAPSQKSGSFSVNFPVDVNYFDELATIIRNELGLALPVKTLTIEAVVHTTADTDYGPIDDVFTQVLTGYLGPDTLVWGEELQSSQASAVTTQQSIPNPAKILLLPISVARIIFPILLVIVSLSLYLLIPSMVRKLLPLSRIEQEARRAKKKYRELIVDVEGFPFTETGAITVISLNSLDDLITAAENLFKPVLHQAEDKQHRYCVIDDFVRYEYVDRL